jgi:D-hexose-6-phosphate mutarotase
MGDHFVKLEEKQDNVHQHTIQNATQSFREIGPLEEKALRKLKAETLPKKHEQYTKQSKHERDKAIDDEVSAILANDDLRSILMDPKMQHIMEECSTIGGKLQYYMRHEEYGPKLRRMMEAGLLKLT